MVKQTKKSGSHFGGKLTREKLTIINDYFGFYVNELSKQHVKLVYIDSFEKAFRARCCKAIT